MSRLLCSLMLALSVALLAFGPTAALADKSSACKNGLDCSGHKGNSDTSGSTCTFGDAGCTVTPTNGGNKNPPGHPCDSPNALCTKKN